MSANTDRIRRESTDDLEFCADLAHIALIATRGEPSNVQRHLKKLMLALNVELIRRYSSDTRFPGQA